MIQLSDRLAANLDRLASIARNRCAFSFLLSAFLTACLAVSAFLLLERIADVGVWGRLAALAIVVAPSSILLASAILARIKKINRRDSALLAKDIHPRFGDAILGAVELSEGKSGMGFSVELVEAAIRQVDAKVGTIDLASGLSFKHVRMLSKLSFLTAAILAVFAALQPGAAWNSFSRLACPFASISRLTFTRLAPAPGKLAVLTGHPYKIQVSLAPGSHVPESACVVFEGVTRSARFDSAGRAVVEMPPARSSGKAELQAGDAAPAELCIEPLPPPSLKSATALIRHPAHLQLPDMETSIQGGALGIPTGSTISLSTIPTRPLAKFSAFRDGRPAMSKLSDDGLSGVAGPFQNIETPMQLSFDWTDVNGLRAMEPFALTVNPLPDLPPTVVCDAKSEHLAILEDERLLLPARAEDDHGVRRLSLEWRRISDIASGGLTPLAATLLLAQGGPTAEKLAAEAVIDPVMMGLAPDDMLECVFKASDFNPATDANPSVSKTIRIKILSKARHAEAILAELSKIQESLSKIAQEEERGRERARSLEKSMKEGAEEEQAGRAAAKLADSEDSNRRRTDAAAKKSAELIRDALRNSSIPPDKVAGMMEMARKLDDLASKDFPSAVQDFKAAAASPSGRQGSVEKASAAQDAILRKLQELMLDTSEFIADFRAGSIAARLRETAGTVSDVASQQTARLAKLAGLIPKQVKVDDRIHGDALAGRQDLAVGDCERIVQDVEAVAETRPHPKYSQILENMRAADPVEGLKSAVGQYRANLLGRGSKASKAWSETLNAWADILDPKDDSPQKPPGEGADGESVDMETMVALCRVLSQECSLRERTRSLDRTAASPIKEAAAPLIDDAIKLAGACSKLAVDQVEIERLSSKVRARVAMTAPKAVEVIRFAEAMMSKSSLGLAQLDTGKTTLGVQSLAIEALSSLLNSGGKSGQAGAAMAAMAQGLGGGVGNGGGGAGGGSPGNLGGTTSEGAPESDAERSGVGGMDLESVPTEYKDATRRYFDRLPALLRNKGK